MANVVGPPKGAVRNRDIVPELKALLSAAADEIGAETVRVVSGGQTSSRAPHLKNVVGGWTGSTRHDNGRAADLQLVKNGSVLSFTDASAGPDVKAFVTACAARGATGIGAGVTYMGPSTFHVGYGTSPADASTLTWGAGGKSANAPAWLKKAAEKGWDNPAMAGATFVAAAAPASDRFVVAARSGLRLRNGPGLGFDVTRTLALGTEVATLGFDGPAGEWARVDLEGDGLIDGHVLAAFLAPAAVTAVGSSEDVEEPEAAEAA